MKNPKRAINHEDHEGTRSNTYMKYIAKEMRLFFSIRREQESNSKIFGLPVNTVVTSIDLVFAFLRG